MFLRINKTEGKLYYSEEGVIVNATPLPKKVAFKSDFLFSGAGEVFQVIFVQ